MVRTQVQLPDEIYREAKRIAAERELTLAEVVRRGLEHMARIYPRILGERSAQDWKLPDPQHLGAFRTPAKEWRELANEPRERQRSRR
jgi:hypothetical protein